MDFTIFKTEFEARYESEIKKLVTRAIDRGANTTIEECIAYIEILAKGGKRFRPYAIQAAYVAEGGIEPNWDILISIELLHLFALIHDDVMDVANERHGVATAHTFASQLYRNDTERVHRGYSVAIILGNIVFSWSNEYFVKGLQTIPEEQRRIIYDYYLSLVEEVNVGQMIDVDLSSGNSASLEEVIIKNKLKSGHYTFMWPFVIGGGLAGANEASINWLKKFGSALGSVFQAQDDILDCSTESGKDICHDVETGQQTLITNYILNAEASVRDKFLSYWRRALSPEEKNEAIALIDASGARAYVQGMIDELCKEVRSMVEEKEENQQIIWNKIIDIVEKRKR